MDSSIPSSTSARFATSATWSAWASGSNQSGGAIMDDFDGDGLLDIVVTSCPTRRSQWRSIAIEATRRSRTGRRPPGLSGQLGGLVCYQADYDNDGLLDIFIPRGAWHEWPMRPTLLRNLGGRFEDVTRASGLLEAANSNAAAWADYDNDGRVDLFVACERQPNRLYRNRGDGTIRRGRGASRRCGCGRAVRQGLLVDRLRQRWLPRPVRQQRPGIRPALSQPARRPVRRGHDVDGDRRPARGFSCWTFDYDNDGWLDIFATSYSDDLGAVLAGMMGLPQRPRPPIACTATAAGKGFDDVTAAAGLDAPHAAMGSQLRRLRQRRVPRYVPGHRRPPLGFLVPNRMLRNVDGKRFADISASSRTGHLQKGHAVACGDWDRDGDIDLFVEMGGAIPGDMYHNVLFQNPGQGNHWLRVKLVGKKTNRAAIGARIKVVTAGSNEADEGPSPRLLGEQLRGQPARADDRPGEGRKGGDAGGPIGRRAGRPRSSATSRSTRSSR